MSDWCLVTYNAKKKKKKTTQKQQPPVVAKPEQDVEKSLTDIKKKYCASKNNKQLSQQRYHAKLEQENQELKHTRMPFGLGIIIQQARQAKGYNQKEFATKICEKPQVIQDYEAGRGILNDFIIEKMEKVLSVKLTGTERGQSLEHKEFKRAPTHK